MSVYRISQRRYISLLDRFRPSNTITTQLPQVAGNGPFLEPPQFNIIGSPSSILDVKLPASAVLNLRLNTSTSIIGINGDIENLTKEVTMIKSSIKPILYQRIFNSNPLSLLISSHLNFETFIVLNVKENWFIKEQNLIAWYGSDIVPNYSKQLLNRFNTCETNGTGVVALKGQGHIFQIDLEEGETMLINPVNVIAYNTPNIGITSVPTKMINFKMPTLTSWESLQLKYRKLVEFIYKTFKIPLTTKPKVENKYITQFNNYLQKKKQLKTDDKLFEIKGPVTLVMQNNV